MNSLVSIFASIFTTRSGSSVCSIMPSKLLYSVYHTLAVGESQPTREGLQVERVAGESSNEVRAKGT